MAVDASLSEPRRAQWRSRLGFVLATTGAAVGLGNVWRFAYVAGENGGGAFLLVYIACVVLIGMPLLVAELALGRIAQRDAVRSFELIGGARRWGAVGWIGVAASFLILTYYAVIAGWVLRYLAGYATGVLWHVPAGEQAQAFAAYIAQPIEPVVWQFVAIAASAAIVLAGVERGIEAVSKALLPVLGLVVVLLAGYGLALQGGEAGLAFLFAPDWSALGRPGVYLAALGQTFFSIGLAMGVLITYGGYIGHRGGLAATAAVVAGADTVFAILAGIAIFPAVFAFGLDPAQGATLAFVTLPQVFSVMPAGIAFGLGFFLLLAVAAITSMVSLIEVPVAVMIDRLGWPRRRAVLMLAAAAFLGGLPSALGFGLWRAVTPFGHGILDLVDHAASGLLLPLSGLATVLFVGWRWSRKAALLAAELEGSAFGACWWMLLRYVLPAVIAVILLGGIAAL
ncbi:sodium-dependent transporter [Desertibaculum subflavum]|uniref:sodium-dependent transporter n=1 Tax=Desertibaculum subflavum TaxID=2268458 RepID=UPI000E662A17